MSIGWEHESCNRYGSYTTRAHTFHTFQNHSVVNTFPVVTSLQVQVVGFHKKKRCRGFWQIVNIKKSSWTVITLAQVIIGFVAQRWSSCSMIKRSWVWVPLGGGLFLLFSFPIIHRLSALTKHLAHQGDTPLSKNCRIPSWDAGSKTDSLNTKWVKRLGALHAIDEWRVWVCFSKVNFDFDNRTISIFEELFEK